MSELNPNDVVAFLDGLVTLCGVTYYLWQQSAVKRLCEVSGVQSIIIDCPTFWMVLF